MTIENMKPDDFWVTLGVKSSSDLEGVFPPIVCSGSLPPAVRHRFDVLGELFTLSYYAHVLLDVAAEYAALTFELALRVRHRELTGCPEDDDTQLYDLVKWADEQRLLDDPVKVVHELRKLRNALVHPHDTQRFGILVPELVGRILDIINGLYEDPRIRAERIEKEMRMNAMLDVVTQRGGVLEVEGTRRDIVLARLLFADMSKSPVEYHLLFWPMFDPTIRDNQVDEGKPVIIMSSTVEACESQFWFGTESAPRLASVTAKAPGDFTFETWRTAFAASTFPLTAAIEAAIAMRRAQVRRRARERGKVALK